MIDEKDDYIRVYGRIMRLLMASPNVCHYCKHFFVKISKDDGIRFCCAAFPDGIPRVIFFSEYDHREPYQNDNGIRFEINPDLTEVERRGVAHRQTVALSKRYNDEVLGKYARLPISKDGKPEYDVIKYCDNDEDSDMSDFEYGEEWLTIYNLIIPHILREGDSDPPMPRYIGGRKSVDHDDFEVMRDYR